MFRLGGRGGGGTKFLYNKYRLTNTSLTAIHNITSYVKVPKLGGRGGGGASRPPPPPASYAYDIVYWRLLTL